MMTLFRVVAIAALGIATFGLLAVASAPPQNAGAVPSCEVMPGWTQEGASRLYEGDHLFEYMDGNSEGYFVYGFVRMNGITCVQGGQKVLIDISEMQDDEGAYGMFSANRDVKLPAESIGAGGQIVPRKAIFVKGKYFVEAAAQAQGDSSELLRKTAAALETRIAGTASVPEQVGWFPIAGLTEGPPRLVPESVLGIRALKRGYVGRYGSAKAFVVTEVSDDAAKQALDKLRTRFGTTEAAALGDEAFQTTDKYLGRICIVRRGRRLVGYAGVPGHLDPVHLTKELLNRIPN
jgi:hypothetical protein